jgi:RNase P/RNase MRP subunit POP5
VSLACVLCGAALTDQAYLCHPETAALATDLRAVPDLLRELEVTTTRQARISAPARGNGDKPLPIDMRASDAATQIRTVLHGWARCLLEEIPEPHGIEDDPRLPAAERSARTFLRHDWAAEVDAQWAAAGRDAAGWLEGNMADVRRQEWAGELAQELRRARENAEHAIDRPESRLYAGPCGNPDSDPPCQATLWAAIDATEVTCRTCGHVWDVEQRRDQLIAAAKDEWLDTVRVASLVSLMTRQRITPVIVNTLAEAGRIRAAGLKLDADDPDLYRVRDVLDALKHIHDHKPATTGDLVTWLRDVHDIDLGDSGQGRIRQWATRYPDDITRAGSDSRGRTLYDRAPILAVARRLAEKLVGAA